ncbi:MAG: kelch repeat-containing protein [Pseudomonadota bacterium]
MVEPNVGRAGTVFRVDIVVSEHLGADPAVRCTTTDNHEIPLLVDESATDRAGRHYRFAHLALGSEGDGPCALSVDLVDTSGNAVQGIAAGTLVFDFTSPRLSGPVLVNPARASTGTAVHVQLGFSEALRQSPALMLVLDDNPSVERPLVEGDQPDLNTYGFDYTVDGSEPEGLYRVRVHALDVAGNSLDTPSEQGVVLDFTGPGLVRAEFEIAVVRRGGSVTLHVEADEGLQRAPELTWGQGGDPGLTLLSSSGASSVFSLTVDASSPEGRFELAAVRLTDLAGNTTVRPATASVIIDRSAPAFVSLAVSPSRVSMQPGFDQIQIDIEVSEPAASLSAELGTRVASCQALDASLITFHCDYLVDSSDLEGAATVTVAVEDAAGNQAFASRSVELDFSPPVVVAGTVNLQLLPATSNVLRTVARATSGTDVHVSFAVSEPLAQAPRVALVGVADGEFTQLGGSSVFYLYGATITTAPDGSYAVEAELVDEVDNRNTVLLDLPYALVVDKTPPVVSVDGLVLSRMPWGAEESVGDPALRLGGHVTLDANTDGGAVIVFDAPAPPRLELGRQFVMPDGSIARFNLNPADRVEVYVAVTDSAGNLSASHRVDAGEWVATMGRKVAGSVQLNPHVFRTRRHFSTPLQANTGPYSGVMEISGAPLALPDGVMAEAQGAAGAWLKVDSTYRLNALVGYHLVDDPGRGPVFLAGVKSGGISVFWNWNGFHWTPAVVDDPEYDGSPLVGPDDSLVYDGRSSRVLLIQASTPMRTWAWNGNSWSNESPDAQVTPARRDFATSYDGASGGVLLFGGQTSGTLGDLWRLRNAGWERVNVTVSPSPRAGSAMAYIPERFEVVLFGGCRSACTQATPQLLGDTWVFTGGAWVTRTTVHAPAPRQGHRMSFLPPSSVILHGGRDASGPLSDFWAYDGVDWLGPFPGPAPILPTAPVGVVYHTMAQQGLAYADHELWSLGSNGWERRPPIPDDPEGDGQPDFHQTPAVMAYNSTTQRTVLSQGKDSTAGLEAVTWEFDGLSWRKLLQGPDSSGSMQMAYDAERSQMILNQGPKLYAFDGTTWNDDQMPATARGGQALAFDPGHDTLLAFGGIEEPVPGSITVSATTWTRGAGGWDTFEAGEGLTPRRDHALGWDGRRVVVFGGLDSFEIQATSLSDMWTWEGSKWEMVDKGDPWPPPMSGHALAWDEAHHRLMLVANAANGEVLWAWDGSTWRLLDERTIDLFGDGVPHTAKKSGRILASYDVERDRLVVFLGTDHTSDGSQWEWVWTDHGRPAATFDIALPASQLPANVIFDGLRLRAVVRGAHPDGSAASVTAYSWIDSDWYSLQQVAPGQDIDFLADEAMTSYAARPGTLRFGFVPEAQNGVDGATLSVDYVEARLLYHLP